MVSQEPYEKPSTSEDTINHASVEAHKQASAEAANDKGKSVKKDDACCASSNRVDPASAPGTDANSGPLKLHGYSVGDDDCSETRSTAREKDECGDVMSPLLSRSEKLCVRHQRMADEDTTARLQKVRTRWRLRQGLPQWGEASTLPAVGGGRLRSNYPVLDESKESSSLKLWPFLSRAIAIETAVNTVWSLFSSSPHSRRAIILRGILTMCCFSQLSLLSSELAMAIRIDPFTLFPREVSLRVLGYLDAISLGRAAQVSRLWRTLADNDLLWRNMCEQHIERKCEKCGWGLPLLTERRARKEQEPLSSSGISLAQDEEYREAAASSGDGSLRRSVTAAANAAALQRRSLLTPHGSPYGSRSQSPADEHAAKRQRLDSDSDTSERSKRIAGKGHGKTRPWKAVYCERLVIERNWRRGRHSVRLLQGHTDGIMSLSFRETVSRLPYPVLITGSYDRTVRVWNLRTGELLRTLCGHARGVRCLQFDDVKLITGSMDRTLKIWNWRTGELLRTLEGHTEGIVSLNFNDSVLASGSADSNVRVWNFHTGECYSLRGHRDWVNAVQLWSAPAPRGRKEDGVVPPMFLFSASDDGTIRLWDLQTRECILVYRGHVGQVQSLKLVMMDHASVRKLSRGTTTLPSNAPIGPDDPLETPPTEGASTPGKTEAAPARSAASCSYTPSNAQDEQMVHASAPALPERFYYQPNGAPNGEEDAESRPRPIPSSIGLTQRRLGAAGLVPPLPAFASMDDIEDGIFCHDEPDGATDAANAKGPCKAKRPVLVSGSLDNTLKLWDVRTGQCFRTLFGHVEGVWSVDVDTLRIVSASHDRTVKVWDRDTAQCQNTLVGHRAAVTCIGLGDDKIVSGSDDGDVRVWSFAPEPLSFPDHKEAACEGKT